MVEDCDYDLIYEELKAKGPFVPIFLTDSKKVWAILHVLFSTSGMWQHVKKSTAVQDGRQVYRTLHSHFVGADKVNTMVNDMLLSYNVMVTVTARTSISTSIVFPLWSNTTATHLSWSTMHPPLEESMKIHYFEEGIKDTTQDAAQNVILFNRTQIPNFNFDSAMQLYVTSKRGQESKTAPQGHNLSAMPWPGRPQWPRSGLPWGPTEGACSSS